MGQRLDSGDGGGMKATTNLSKRNILNPLQSLNKRLLRVVSTEPNGGGISENRKNTSFEKNPDMPLRQTSNRIGQKANAVSDRGGSVRHNLDMVLESQFLIKENTQPADDWFGLDDEISSI